jgi:hypothetical protein
MSNKQGIDLIIDRIEALRVRIVSNNITREQPPLSEDDHRSLERQTHWVKLCEEALHEAILWRAGVERVTAQLALARSAPIAEIVSAVEQMLKRLQDLEAKQTNATRTIDGLLDGEKLSRIDRAPASAHDDEPRASWVLEYAVRLMLWGWLIDGAKLVERVGQHMADNERDFSEDIFDELREISERLERIAVAIKGRDEHRVRR